MRAATLHGTPRLHYRRWLVASTLFAVAATAWAAVPEASIVKLQTVSAKGAVQWGSGVVIGPGRVATACHVTRNATVIEASQGSRRWIVREHAGSVAHDLCVLTIDGLELPPVTSRPAQDMSPGEPVDAAGFEGGGDALVTSSGTVKGLYRFDDGAVIRTSAAFDSGASGGGLFDATGRLVGVLAFRARSGGNLRFALPAEWLAPDSPVAATFVPVDPASAEGAFWERSAPNRPEFLGAALREARGPAP